MCKECNTNPVYEFTNKRKLCKKCFIKYFQKKILYTVRRFEMLRKDEVIGYEHKPDFRSVVLEDILKIFGEKWIVELVELPSKKEIDKIAIASTIDLESGKIVHEIIKGDIRKLNAKPVDRKVIKPLYLFLDEEVLLYAKLRKLKFKKGKVKEDEIGKFINELEIKHPEVKRAIVNGYLELFPITPTKKK